MAIAGKCQLVTIRKIAAQAHPLSVEMLFIQKLLKTSHPTRCRGVPKALPYRTTFSTSYITRCTTFLVSYRDMCSNRVPLPIINLLLHHWIEVNLGTHLKQRCAETLSLERGGLLTMLLLAEERSRKML